jgi:hypothetical protein
MSKRRSSKKNKSDIDTKLGLSIEESFTLAEWEAGLEVLSNYDVDAYSNFVIEKSSAGLNRFTPEVRLRIAALGDAIWCLQKGPRKKKRSNSAESAGITANKLAAQAWLNGDCKSEPTFSFVEVCEIIGLNPNATRKAIFSMTKKRKFDIRELVFWLK